MEQYAQLSDSELEVMQIIWEMGGSARFAQISAALEKQGKQWKTNTILAFLNRLIRKGIVTVTKLGRLNEYTALVTQEAFMAEKTRIFVNKMYGGNLKGLISTLLKQDDFSEEDYQEIVKFWETEKRKK